MLGVASIVVTEGVIGAWVEASAGGVANAIVRPAVSLSYWNRVSCTIAVTAAGLVMTPAALGLECTIGGSFFSRDCDGIGGHSS